MAALSEKPAVVAVGGPTATGKTALAVHLARVFGGEVISADSMQVYRGLDIGTAKATEAERQGVPHHLLDILDPAQPFSVADFVAAAGRCIDTLTAAGTLPILAGGTGLYLTSLLGGMDFTPEKPDPALRTALERRAAAEGREALYAELQRVDPAYAAAVHPNNLPRVIRALELYAATGRRMSEERRAARPAEPPYRSLCLCLAFRDRQTLYRRIDERVDRMMAAGLLDEARTVYENRDRYRTAAQAIGYKELFPFFAGAAPLESCVADLKQASRRYAKRQLTWFRHQGEVQWLWLDEPDAPPVQQRAEALVRAFLARGQGG